MAFLEDLKSFATFLAGEVAESANKRGFSSLSRSDIYYLSDDMGAYIFTAAAGGGEKSIKKAAISLVGRRKNATSSEIYDALRKYEEEFDTNLDLDSRDMIEKAIAMVMPSHPLKLIERLYKLSEIGMLIHIAKETTNWAYEKGYKN